MPNRAALQKMALDYYNKYDILIRETVLDDLKNLLVEIETALDNSGCGAQFVGINVALNNNYSHALPLVCYFGDKDPEMGIRSKEFLIADTLGDSHLLYYHVEFILSIVAQTKIYHVINARQVDSLSCRTGGMLLLKRALISL